jgi:hypothetical protein
MTRFDLLKRQFGYFALGITVAIGLLAGQTVGAMQPLPGQGATGPVVVTPCPAQLAGPRIDKVKAWRAAGGVAYVQVNVEQTNDVQLMMAGTISLKSHDAYNCYAVWEFYITGLTPNTLYDFTVAAIGANATVYYNGSVMT